MPRAMDNYLDLKFLAIGDSGVGKTCILNQYVDGKFTKQLGTTVGIDIRNKTIFYTSNKTNKIYNVQLQLWDTAGQERYRSLTTSFFRDAMGFMLVFDVTSETSFLNVRNWIGEIQSNAYSENVDMILIGNKCDLEDERIITKIRALEFAQQYHVQYIETSALENRNVVESIELLLDTVMKRLDGDENFSKRNSSLPTKSSEQIELDLLKKKTKTRTDLSYCCNY
ncbi:unnamed protein product [Adineta steineri]|uniref:Uncharacterized protein n=1 Tax=Adineta steineri TaxID=433720 RepID=A0A816CS01_9BILA|nr:unnamed protein product [Adineta steineri]CAF1034727.1 unnamed protein product [Adineta steineri]CAF1132257.1 unnamed protein product [Adineta steineri]CAF1238135.1 unnamed protein product [Adineta steineri]CAF1434306.1 unnamed protein product [Adineta steineri]